jgi:exonuclease III
MKMNQLVLFLFFSIPSILLSGCSNAPTAPKPTELKVMAWNIWHGGHAKEYPQKGCEGTLDILKKSNADVILMIETYGSADQVADHLGYYHRLLSSNLSIYSRYPITKTYTFPEVSTFNFGGVEIDMNGQKVRLFDTWLHYLPDARLAPCEKSSEEILAWDDAGSRDEEVRKIIEVLQPFLAQTDSIPMIMGGDFNSHSHLDWTEATKNLYNHGGAVVDWTVSKEMEGAGFKDSHRTIHPDPVKNIGTTWIYGPESNRAQQRDDRIDYIYYKGKTIEAIASETYNQELGKLLNFKNENFFYASDHGFVLSTFKIK